MSNSVANTEADLNLGALSQIRVELWRQLADVERRGAIWHYEEICKVLATYVGEGAAMLLAGEQSAPPVATSAGQQPQEQPERCVRHGSPLLFPFSDLCNAFLAPDHDHSSLSLIAALQSKCAPFVTNFNSERSFFVAPCIGNR
jgi:hypothetical protein